MSRAPGRSRIGTRAAAGESADMTWTAYVWLRIDYGYRVWMADGAVRIEKVAGWWREILVPLNGATWAF